MSVANRITTANLVSTDVFSTNLTASLATLSQLELAGVGNIGQAHVFGDLTLDGSLYSTNPSASFNVTQFNASSVAVTGLVSAGSGLFASNVSAGNITLTGQLNTTRVLSGFFGGVNVGVSGNVSANKVYAANYYFANGQPFTSNAGG